MAKTPVSIEMSGIDQNNLSVSLSKEEFGRFFESLLSSPREQSETQFLGFDITLADTKNIIEKILAHVKVQNNLLRHDFTGQIYFSDGSSLTEFSMDNFYGRRMDGLTKPVRFILTIKLIIGFNRSDEKINFEQQVVTIDLGSGPMGVSTIRIRSTDFSWPQGIFLLYKRCLDEHNLTVNPKGITSGNRFLFLSGLFLDVSRDNPYRAIYRNASVKIATYRSLTLALFGMTAFCIFLASLVMTSAGTRNAHIFNPENTEFELHTMAPSDIQEWERFSELYFLSNILARTGQFEHKENSLHLPSALTQILGNIPLWSFLVSAAFATYVYVCFLDAKRLESLQEGRLFITDSHKSPRKIENLIYGILPAIFTGVLTAMFSTFIISFI